jgi:hypothetical protein
MLPGIRYDYDQKKGDMLSLSLARNFLQNMFLRQRALLEESRALINCDRRLMVVWSPKSACTSTYVWFAAQSGLIEEMRATHHWPHRHRRTVYLHSDLYRRSLRLPLSAYRIVRVIRDPYTRAASIYRHSLVNDYLDEYLEDFQGSRLNRKQGLSFQQFLDLLESLDLRKANPHLRPQYRRIELLRSPDITINISKADLFAELNKTERSFGLPVTDFGGLEWLMGMEQKRKAKDMPIDGERLDERPFSRRAALGSAPFPAYEQLLTRAAKERIRRLYEIDFEAYEAHL